MNLKNMKITKKGATVGGVCAVALLAALLSSGSFGLGSGTDLGNSSPEKDPEQTAVVETAATVPETPEITLEPVESRVESVEIRIRGREYNYRNVTYGNKDHTTEELLNELADLPRDVRIDLIVEDNATKNAVDELVLALTEAGFSSIHK